MYTLKAIAQAMRDGAAMGPQVFGTLTDGHGSCAIGSAMLGGEGHIFGWRTEDEFLGLTRKGVPCPACRETHMVSGFVDIGTQVIELNNLHRWTREDIADWLEALEEPSVAVDLRVDAEAEKVLR